MIRAGFNLNQSYLTLPSEFFSQVTPQPVSAPELVIVNEALANQLGLALNSLDDSTRADLFTGNVLPAGARPFSQAYAGHQFGHFTPLGDGRAVLWGEHITPDGHSVDIQYKGSGRTPYSRRGDGRAALGPMLREYLISEAMHALGIPTTRSLAVATTGEQVMRDEPLPGAVLTRVASSHIRVGTFEFAATQPSVELLQALLRYTINRHYPELNDTPNPAIALLDAVIERQLALVVHWMRVGFIHGVMNTDNVSIAGETIDYGPCAFMDYYDPATVFSSIDQHGRYAYANQPLITQWNLARFAEALLPLIHPETAHAIAIAEERVSGFSARYHTQWLEMMRAKLGLQVQDPEDEQLIDDLLSWMQQHHVDYTTTFRRLCHEETPSDPVYQHEEFKSWYQRWQARQHHESQSPAVARRKMSELNPAVIPRNHHVESALQAATMGDRAPFTRLLTVLQNPYQESVANRAYQAAPYPSEQVFQTFCGT